MRTIIMYFSIGSTLLPVVTYFFTKSHFKSSKWLLVYLLTSFSFELIILAIDKKIVFLDIRYIIHSCLIFEYLIVSFYFNYQKIFTNHFRNIIPALAIFATIIYLTLILNDKFLRFNTIGCALFCFVIIVYCILGFIKLVKRDIPVFLEQTSFFWTICGFLLFYSGNFFLFIFWAQISPSKLYPTLWFFVHDVLNIIKYIFIAISFTKKQDQ
jgi:hypothetical protein